MNKCDLIMKGGITSGVVYPKVITELAKEYQFVNVGGTSAGAIAAGFTAAAEYNRAKNQSDQGFQVLDSIPIELSTKLLDLFEPEKVHKKTFKYLLGLQKSGTLKTVFSTVWNFFRLRKSLKKLPDTNFGLCSGMSKNLNENEALTDWMNLWIEKSAGRATSYQDLPSIPLTFGKLSEQGIKLRTITTNLSQRTPVNLPNIGHSYVKKTDIEKLMPKNVVDYVASVQDQISSTREIADRDDYYILPSKDLMPVLLGMRLSLSFPILLSAFPIYRIDNSLRLCKEEQKKPKLCWLSDGGITSNFPIHLFDSVFPSRPTFGISLGEFDECRQDPDQDVDDPSLENRVYLPQGANRGLSVQVHQVNGIFGFLMSIFNSAQTWQDTNQTYLSGYRERVVRLSLKDDEGGMNLSMPPERIAALTKIGRVAGARLKNEFDLPEHKWRRVLSAYSAVESAFEGLQEQYLEASPESMKEFIDQYRKDFENGNLNVDSYKPVSANEILVLQKRLDELAQLAKKWSQDPIRKSWGSSGMPKPSSALKITPERFIG